MDEEKKKSGRPISSPAPWGELFQKVGQEQIAQELGVAKSTVGKWARQVHRIPKLARDELLRICKANGIEDGLEQLERF